MQNFFNTLEVLAQSDNRYIKGHALDLLRREQEVIEVIEDYKKIELPTIKY